MQCVLVSELSAWYDNGSVAKSSNLTLEGNRKNPLCKDRKDGIFLTVFYTGRYFVEGGEMR